MQRCPDDRFVIAGSPVYISAAEQDILAGVPALHDAAAQLIIVTSQGYRGPLQPFLKRSRADMMATLKSNMTCLNIACAGALIDAMMQADARGRRRPFNTDRDWRYRRQKGVLHVQHHLSRRRSRPFPGHEPGGRRRPPAS
ncbi:hypothetical protein [Serratia marcescens]|uniref:hypothetical protein n=1 Tax=Serratia marcescens TaxID=615 RepID=UPI001F5B1AC8|nr:hypothetical protein [Serratia marcescens]